MFHANDTLGEVVAKFPNAATVFQNSRLDFCCGGDRTLAAAVAESGELDLEDLLSVLNRAWSLQMAQNEPAEDWRDASLTALVDHIFQQHHAYLHQNLPLIGELTTKILRVHGARHGDVLTPLHRQFHRFKMEMEEHLIEEEVQVFPKIKEFERSHSRDLLAEAIRRIDKLEGDHDQAGYLLKTMRETTKDYKLPDDACRTFVRTYQMLEEAEDNTFVHVHLENNILFPRLRHLATQ